MVALLGGATTATGQGFLNEQAACNDRCVAQMNSGIRSGYEANICVMQCTARALQQAGQDLDQADA